MGGKNSPQSVTTLLLLEIVHQNEEHKTNGKKQLQKSLDEE